MSFRVDRDGPVLLDVYDLAGRRVTTLWDGSVSAGPHTLTWNGRTGSGSEAAAGVYLCRLQAGGLNQTIRLTLVR